jgi:hypothetical protein
MTFLEEKERKKFNRTHFVKGNILFYTKGLFSKTTYEYLIRFLKAKEKI